jgi:hypothetical protein
LEQDGSITTAAVAAAAATGGGGGGTENWVGDNSSKDAATLVAMLPLLLVEPDADVNLNRCGIDSTGCVQSSLLLSSSFSSS